MSRRKGFLTFALIGIMAIQSIRIGPAVVRAEESMESYTGLKHQIIVEEDIGDCVVTDAKYSHASVANAIYSEYTNDYYYSRLSDCEKALYDGLYMECQRLLLNNDSIAVYGNYWGDDYGLTSYVSYTGLSTEQVSRTAWIFQMANPQFYFFNGILHLSSPYDNPSMGMVALGVYDAFLDGNARAAATAKVFQKASQFVSQINAKSSQYEKEKLAYELIINNTIYQYGAYDQSAYSVFVEGTSVCTGYALAFSMLCNAAGIQTISVTSDSHVWNYVNIGGAWYNVDSTWGDGQYDIYAYLNKGTITMTAKDYDGSHVPESLWNGLLPSISSSDFNPNSIGYSVMYRLYNPNSGEHFYTADGNEKNYLDAIGWNYEGESWTAPSYSATPVYRLYNPVAGDHHYTINYAEVVNLTSLGWSFEGVGWYSSDSANIALYRLYNPNAVTGTHHYTANYGEAMYLQNIGWSFEGVGWYGK